MEFKRGAIGGKNSQGLLYFCSRGRSFGFVVCLFHATVSGLKDPRIAAIGEVLARSLVSPGDK